MLTKVKSVYYIFISLTSYHYSYKMYTNSIVSNYLTIILTILTTIVVIVAKMVSVFILYTSNTISQFKVTKPVC